MGRRLRYVTWIVALAAARAATANAFPYHLLRRIALPGTASVGALVFDPRAASVYVGLGHFVRVYTLTGTLRTLDRRLHGTVKALVAVTNNEIVAAVRHPNSLDFLTSTSLQVLRRRPLGSTRPSALLYDPYAHLLFLESRSSHTLMRLDPETGKPLGSVRLSGKLGEVASNGRGTLYVADATHDAVDVISALHMRYQGAIPLTRCHAPTGLAMDRVGRRLFVACSNGRALIVDADLGFTFVRLPIQRAAHLHTVFAFRPLGSGGWKGGAFIAGGGRVGAIDMRTFVRYQGGGHLVLASCCTALTLAPPADELWLASGRKGGEHAKLWVFGTRESP